jgi:hypothetical protein
MGTDAGGLRGHVAATIAALEPRLETAIYLGLHRCTTPAAPTVPEEGG